MKPAYVWSQSAWMPGRAGADAVLQQASPDAAQLQPDMGTFPSRLMRGTSPITRALVWTARDAMRRASVDECFTVFGSALGESSIALRQLEMMVTGDGKISPTLFKNSVHNTAAGVLSVADRNRRASTSIATGELTVASALLEGMLQLHDGASTVVVGVGDEALIQPLSQLGVWPLFAAAWVLRAVPPPHATVGLEAVVQGKGDPPGVPEDLATHPCRSAFTVLDAVAHRRSGEFVLAVEDDACPAVRIRAHSGGHGAKP